MTQTDPIARRAFLSDRRRDGRRAHAIDGRPSPALLAGYRDLDDPALRFPARAAQRRRRDLPCASLTSLVDEPARERWRCEDDEASASRQPLLRLEREFRVAGRRRGRRHASALWDAAVDAARALGPTLRFAEQTSARARSTLKRLAPRLRRGACRTAWCSTSGSFGADAADGSAFARTIERLMLRLSGHPARRLHALQRRPRAGRLKASVGNGLRRRFRFRRDVARPRARPPARADARRRGASRIRRLRVLEAQPSSLPTRAARADGRLSLPLRRAARRRTRRGASACRGWWSSHRRSRSPSSRSTAAYDRAARRAVRVVRCERRSARRAEPLPRLPRLPRRHDARRAE